MANTNSKDVPHLEISDEQKLFMKWEKIKPKGFDKKIAIFYTFFFPVTLLVSFIITMSYGLVKSFTLPFSYYSSYRLSMIKVYLKNNLKTLQEKQKNE